MTLFFLENFLSFVEIIRYKISNTNCTIMKKFLLSLMALVGTIAAIAQISDGVSATLQNGETTSVFYGYDSFKDAVAAAPEEGSVITLSPGAFSNPGAITKSMKIYGAGFEKDASNNISETRVNGDLTITSTDEFSPVVRIEGIYYTGQAVINGTQLVANTEIIKCSFGYFYNRAETNNIIIRQCYIRNWVNGQDKKTTAFVVANCWLRGMEPNFAAGSQVSVDHCIIVDSWDSQGPYFYTNNIINPAHYYRFSAGATCYNNVCSNNKLDVGGNNVCEGNYDQSLWTDCKTLFADGQDNWDYATEDGTPRTWELANPDTYVGTDGTPCGVTGGNFPWNPIPSTPRIISTSVDSKSEPGKLKVSIKAEARPLE